MKKLKKLLSVMLCITLSMATLMMPTKAKAATGTWQIGATTNDKVTAVLTDDGLLNISGTGKMKDWTASSSAPWYTSRSTITSIIVEEGVTNLGAYAISSCTNLTNISLSNTITSMGTCSIYSTTRLKSLSIPSSVKTMVKQALYANDALRNLYIYSTDVVLDKDAIYHYTSMGTKAVIVHGYNGSTAQQHAITYGFPFKEIDSDNNIVKEWDVSKDNDESVKALLSDTGILTIKGKGEMQNYTSETALPWYSMIKLLTKIEVLDGVTNIGSYAFSNLQQDMEVIIPKGLLLIGDYAFSNSKISSIIIPDTVTSIGAYAFNKCSSLTAFTMPDSVISVGEHAFDSCTSLKDITFSKSLKTIEAFTFFSNTALENITMSDSIIDIKENAFKDCNKITNIRFSESLETIGNYAFGITNTTNSKITELEFPESLISIGDYAFYNNNSNISSLKLSNSLQTIGNFVFDGTYTNTVMTKLIFGDSLVSIGENSFRCFSKISEIDFGKGNLAIGKNAIRGVGIRLDIPASIKSIAYYGITWTNVKDVYVEGKDTVFEASAITPETGVMFHGYEGSTIHAYTDMYSRLFIPYGQEDSGVLKTADMTSNKDRSVLGRLYEDGTFVVSGNGEISGNSLYWNGIKTYITNIVIEEGVTLIGMNAFSGCPKLTRAVIPPSVKRVNAGAFTDCSNFTNIYIESMDAVFDSKVDAVKISLPIQKHTIIHGYNSSTAKSYANLNGNIFEEISEAESKPTVPQQTLTYDKFTKSSNVINVTMGLGNDKASGIAKVILGDTQLKNSDWEYSANKIKIKSDILDKLEVDTAHFVTIVFDDFNDTSIKNVKIKIVDTTPILDPTVETYNPVFDKASPKDLTWKYDLGTTASQLLLEVDGKLLSDLDYHSNGKGTMTVFKSYLEKLPNGDHTVSFKFSMSKETTITDTITIKGEALSKPIIEEQNAKYSNSDIVFNVQFGNVATEIVKVVVNGQSLPKMYFNSQASSLVISREYLDALANGLYTVSVEFNDGTIITDKLSILVPKNTGSVNTGNSLLNIVYVNGSNKDISFPLAGNPTAIEGLYANYNLVPSEYFSYNPINSRITISSQFLNELGLGTHSLVITVDYGGGLRLFSFGTLGSLTDMAQSDLGIIVASIEKGSTGLTYEKDKDGNVIITGNEGTDKDIIIPEEIDGSPVTGIEDINNGQSGGTVTIPGGVTEIKPGGIPGDKEIIGEPGSAGEDYAKDNGNTFTPNDGSGESGGTNPGGGNGGTTTGTSIPKQNVQYNKNDRKDIEIVGVQLGDATKIDYIIIGNYKIYADGTIENLLGLKLMRVVAATGGAITINNPFTLDSNGKLVINKDLLEQLNLADGNFNIEVGFDNGTIINDAIKLEVVSKDNGNGGGTTTPTPTPDPGNGGGTTTPTPTPDPGNGGGTTTPTPTPDPGNGGGTTTPTPTPDPGNGGGTTTPTPTPDPGTGNGNGGGNTTDPGTGGNGNGTNSGGTGTDLENGTDIEAKRSVTRTISVGSKININIINKQKGSKLVYKSSNPEVAYVNPNSGIVTANKAGKVVITATSTYNGEKTVYTITLNVTKAKGCKTILASTREVNKDGCILLNNEFDKVSFTVTNKNLINVDKNGKLNAGKNKGTTTVKVVETTNDIQFKYTVKVKIK